MSIINELSFRPVDPKHDLAYSYDVFKRTIGPYVKELTGGVWPERPRYDFFKKGFSEPGMMMIEHKGTPIGCFCITEDDCSVILQRMYFEPSYQRQGIGSHIMGLALKRAHDTKKPLNLEVLSNNKPAVSAYLKNGFVAFEKVTTGWNQKLLMRHSATEQYAEESAKHYLQIQQNVRPPYCKVSYNPG